MKKVSAAFTSVTAVYGGLVTTVMADAPSPSPLFKDPTGIGGTAGVGDVQQLVINIIFSIAGFLAVAYFMYGGIRWITSRGDRNAVTDARKTVVSALIGMVLVAGAYFAINTIFNIIGGNNPLTGGLPTLTRTGR